MSRIATLVLSTLIALFVATPAQAQDVEAEESASDFSLVLGVSEVTTTKFEHLICFEQVGVSRFVPLSEDWALIPIVIFEVSPGTDAYDFVGVLVLERAITDSVFLDVSGITVWDPSQGESVWFFGAGAGPTFLLPWGHMVSPSFSVLRGAGETVLNPAIAWSIPL